MSASIPQTASLEGKTAVKDSSAPQHPGPQGQFLSEKADAGCVPGLLELGTDETVDSQRSGGLSSKPLQRWNETPTNRLRFLTTIYCFIIMGMNDACFGALLPYVEAYYSLSYTVISLVFLVPFLGYLCAAMCNNLIHYHVGQRGVAIIAPLCRLAGYIPISFHPPFAVLPVVMLFPGFGSGLEDSAWNAWVGNMQNANELLGLLHGAYGLGATIGPLVATAMVTKGGLPWYTFFYLMTGLAASEVFLTTTAFWSATGSAYRAAHAREDSDETGGGRRTTTRRVLREPLTWLLSLFLLAYVGGEVSLGGWIVTFMLRVRHAEEFAAGMSVTGFWLGLTVGRVLLGFVTGRIGEKLATTIYLCFTIVLELLYWLIPNFIASAIFVAFLGFFLGPLFPAAIVALTKLLPSSYHVSAIGVAAAMGGAGGALFPFMVGAIAQHKGVEVLQPFSLAIFVFITVLWLAVPGGLRRGGLEQAKENNEKVGVQVKKAWDWLKAWLGRSSEGE